MGQNVIDVKAPTWDQTKVTIQHLKNDKIVEENGLINELIKERSATDNIQP